MDDNDTALRTLSPPLPSEPHTHSLSELTSHSSHLWKSSQHARIYLVFDLSHLTFCRPQSCQMGCQGRGRVPRRSERAGSTSSMAMQTDMPWWSSRQRPYMHARTCVHPDAETHVHPFTCEAYVDHHSSSREHYRCILVCGDTAASHLPTPTSRAMPRSGVLVPATHHLHCPDEAEGRGWQGG